eukprot:1002756-Pyramimonas_sp.AAC.1
MGAVDLPRRAGLRQPIARVPCRRWALRGGKAPSCCRLPMGMGVRHPWDPRGCASWCYAVAACDVCP